MGLLDRFTSKKGKAQAAPKGAPKVDRVEAKEQAKKESFRRVPAEKKEDAPVEKKASAVSAESRQATGNSYRVLLGAVVTEKSARLEQGSQYVFMIAPTATKKLVSEAVQKVYGVKPVAVNIVNLPGKWVRYGRSTGKQPPRRKAVITVPMGKKIDLTA